MIRPRIRKQLLALYLLCLGVLMILLDTTIVTVAMPSIVADLRLSDTSATWILNAYMLTFGGFLLLSGRLGDLYGRRRVFLAGVGVFTLASLACGMVHTPIGLIMSRGAQGLAGAAISSCSLSLIMDLFTTPDQRAMAMGIYGFVCAAGGGVGELLGGFLTAMLNWHWIFLINVPLGVAVLVFGSRLLPAKDPSSAKLRLDIVGAATITTALGLLVYTTVDSGGIARTTTGNLILLAIVATLVLVFVHVESRARQPLVPLRLFRLRNFTVANVLGVLWSAGTFAWFVIAALYLQRVLAYDPFRVGLAFLPATTLMGLFSAGLSGKLVIRFGVRGPLAVALLCNAIGLLLFARGPTAATFLLDVMPGMLLLGLGCGMASTPLLLAAMNDVGKNETGLASGIVNTSILMGGALGLALLATLADQRTQELERSGVMAITAVNAGYHVAFLIGAVLSAAGSMIGWWMLQPRMSSQAQQPAKASHELGRRARRLSRRIAYK